MPAPIATRREGPDAGRRERDFAHSSGLPPGPRRGPGLRRARRDDVPRRDPAHGRRVHGGRRLLRPVRLPHHLAPDRRVAPEPDHQARRILGPPGAAPPPGHAPDAALRRLPRVGDRAPGDLRGAPPGRAVHAALCEQLALHPRQFQLLQRDRGLLPAPAHLVTRGRGTVLRDLAARGPRRHALHEEPAGPVRAVLCRRDRVGDLDVRALRRRPQHQPGVPRAPTPAPSACSSGAPSPSGSSWSRSEATRRAASPRASCGDPRAAPGRWRAG